MTTPMGQTGSPNPGNATTRHAPLIVRDLQRVKESQPTTWQGVTPDGHLVHVSYLFGEVKVDVRRPVPDKPGHYAWITAVAFRPALVEAEVDSRSVAERQMQRIVAERAVAAEIRRSSAADMATQARFGKAADLLVRDRLIIRDRQLVAWMGKRSRHLPQLRRAGLDGGPGEVHLELPKAEKEEVAQQGRPAALAAGRICTEARQTENGRRP